MPLIVLAGLAFSDRGIGGTVSDRWDELTHRAEDSAERPGPPDRDRATCARSTGRARSTCGASTRSPARARARSPRRSCASATEPTQGRHAHGYVHQTLADLGLIGLAASLAALVGWLLATRITLGLSRSRLLRGVDPRAHGPAGARARGDRVRRALGARLDLVRARRRDHRAVLRRLGRRAAGRCRRDGCAGRRRRRRAAGAAARAAARAARRRGGRGRWRSPSSRRSRSRSRGARTTRATRRCALLDKGDFAGARAAADRASDINPLSAEPYFERAAIEDAAGKRRRGRAGARGRRAARARQPGGVAAARRVLRGQPRRPGARGAGPPGRAVPRPGLDAQPQRLPGRAARPRRGRGRARRRASGRPAAPRRAAAPRVPRAAAQPAAPAPRPRPTTARCRARRPSAISVSRSSGGPPRASTSTCSKPKSRSSARSDRAV